MIRLACHRDDDRHRFYEPPLCGSRAIACDALLLASRFALETIQHRVEAIDQLSDLAAGSVARPQTVVLAIADPLGDAGQLADWTGDLPGDDEDEAKRGQPHQGRRAEIN